MGRRVSKKKIFEYLETVEAEFPELQGVSKLQLKHSRVGNEAYGNYACLYITMNTVEHRRKLEARLMSMGYEVNRTYCRELPTLEVEVTYFKGVNWDA